MRMDKKLALAEICFMRTSEQILLDHKRNNENYKHHNQFCRISQKLGRTH
jgi:hypothetical protein